MPTRPLGGSSALINVYLPRFRVYFAGHCAQRLLWCYCCTVLPDFFLSKNAKPPKIWHSPMPNPNSAQNALQVQHFRSPKWAPQTSRAKNVNKYAKDLQYASFQDKCQTEISNAKRFFKMPNLWGPALKNAKRQHCCCTFFSVFSSLSPLLIQFLGLHLCCVPLSSPFRCSRAFHRFRCGFSRPLAASLCFVAGVWWKEPAGFSHLWLYSTCSLKLPQNLGGGFGHLGAWPPHSVGFFGTAALKSLH